jgi:hypothetical protein
MYIVKEAKMLIILPLFEMKCEVYLGISNDNKGPFHVSY